MCVEEVGCLPLSPTTSATRVLIAFTKECVQLEYFSHWLGSHNKYDDDGDIAWLAHYRFEQDESLTKSATHSENAIKSI